MGVKLMVVTVQGSNSTQTPVPSATKTMKFTYLSYNQPSRQRSMCSGVWGASGRGLGSTRLPTLPTPRVLEELFDDGGCRPIVFELRVLLSHLLPKGVNS